MIMQMTNMPEFQKITLDEVVLELEGILRNLEPGNPALDRAFVLEEDGSDVTIWQGIGNWFGKWFW